MEAMVPIPRIELLLEDRTHSSATIIARQWEDSTEDIDACPQITNELVARRPHKMEWEEKGRFPSKAQWH